MFNLDFIKSYMKEKEENKELTDDQKKAFELFNAKCKSVKKVVEIENTSYSLYQIDKALLKQFIEEKENVGMSNISLNAFELKYFKYGAIRNSKIPF